MSVSESPVACQARFSFLLFGSVLLDLVHTEKGRFLATRLLRPQLPASGMLPRCVGHIFFRGMVSSRETQQTLLVFFDGGFLVYEWGLALGGVIWGPL